jgi:polar amino acid transport system substrate-binding protein
MRATRIRIVLAVLAAMAMLGAACGGGDSGDALAQVMDSGKLRVSTDPAYPPQSSLNDAGEYEGFDIDVATEIAKRMGVEVQWETPSWELITAGGWNDRWDASVGSMTITPERSQVLFFTPPYYYTPAAIAVHADNTTINGPDDLTGANIGVCGGCTYDTYLQGTLELPKDESGNPEAIPSQIQDPQITTYDTDSTAIQDLALGDGARLDAVISALPTLLTAIDDGSPIKIIGEPLFYEPLSVALDKNAEADQTSLLDNISGIIEEMHSDGTLTQLSQKWYDADLTVTTP